MKRTSVAQPDVATLFIAASEHDSNLYYATKFMAPDPFIYLECAKVWKFGVRS